MDERPEEPMGYGAVIQTRDGRVCVRALHQKYPWICEDHAGGWREYEQIPNVVKVLSMGVHPSALKQVTFIKEVEEW